MNLEEFRATLLIVGAAKKGKTEFLLSAPDPLFWQWDANAAGPELCGHPVIDFTAMEPKDAWKLFSEIVLPATYNRDLTKLQQYVTPKGTDLSKIKSICHDSETFCFETMQDAIPIPRTGKGEPDTYKWYRILREVKKQQYYRCTGIARPFPGDPARPRYNFVAACHMKEEYMDVAGTDKRILSRWVPAIEGSFKDKLPAYTNCLFWADSKREGDKTTYFLHTKSPDKFRSADDSIGGRGPFKVLPPRIDNNWQALLEGWGVGQAK